MYPKTLKQDYKKTYWSDDSAFNKESNISTYMHYNYDHGMHSHSFYEINIIYKGEGMHYIAESSIYAKKGDVFVIPPNISHGYYSKSNLDIYHLLIKNDFIKKYNEDLSKFKGYNMLFDIEPLFRTSSIKTNNLKLSESELEKIYEDLKYIHSVGEEKDYLLENILSLALIGKLSRMFYKKTNDKNNEIKENADLLKIISYIKNNLDGNLSVEMLSKYVNISPSTLNRRFRENLNISTAEFVLGCRTTRAKELLKQNNYSKAEIAQMCGFYDTSHMNKYLKE